MKRKNGEKNYGLALFAIAVSWTITALIIWGVVAFLRGDGNDMPCVPFADVDFVMYGFEGNRGTRSDSPALLDALADMHLNRVVTLNDGFQKHMDMGLYEGFGLVGTVLFLHDDGMGRWWIVMNDNMRGECGFYQVAAGDVLRVFDALRDE